MLFYHIVHYLYVINDVVILYSKYFLWCFVVVVVVAIVVCLLDCNLSYLYPILSYPILLPGARSFRCAGA